jgi:hypothetical protein
MRVRRSGAVVALVTGLGLVAAAAGTPLAAADGRSGHRNVKVIASGLEGPFGLQAVFGHDGHRKGNRTGAGRTFVVADNVAGQVTKIDKQGKLSTLITAPGVSGVAAGLGKVFAVMGGPNEEGTPPPGPFPPSSLVRAGSNGHHAEVISDLLQYEMDHNPDGQVQFVDGVPPDALSNPFSMNLSWFGLLVADGGANDVLKVNPWNGKVSTFFVPPTVTDVPACLEAGAQANPGTVGCDPVPTGIAVANGSVYVSTLGAEVPGAGRVYKLNPFTGEVRKVWKGLTAPTGVAVRPNGTIYVSEVLYGAPAGRVGQLAKGFDPSTIGRITRIRHGVQTHAAVTMPTGLQFTNGQLYSTAWSIASFFGIQGAGQVVQVDRHAFH